MSTTPSRTERADQPPSTSGTSSRRARLWSAGAIVLVAAVVGLAAQVVAADPASEPVTTTTLSRSVKTITEAVPAKPIRAAQQPSLRAFAELGDVTLVSAATASRAAGRIDVTPPPPPTTTTTTSTTTTAPPAPAPAPVAAPSTGRCGGDLPPCWVMMRESGGNIQAKNPSSSASGKWQFINSTWAGFGGYAEAWMAPESVQDAKARQLWAGGAGCGHWAAC